MFVHSVYTFKYEGMYLQLHVYVYGAVHLPAHTGTQTVTARTQTELQPSQGPRLSPVARGTMLYVVPLDHVRESPAVCHSSASLRWESCWGAYVGSDTWLRWHMCVAMHLYKQWPPTSLTTQTHTHTHTLNHLEITHILACMHTNIKYTATNLHTHTHSHSHRPDALPSRSPVKQITVSPAAHFLPAPLHCRGNNTIATSWITSSIICIRFDGVKALATI